VLQVGVCGRKGGKKRRERGGRKSRPKSGDGVTTSPSISSGKDRGTRKLGRRRTELLKGKERRGFHSETLGRERREKERGMNVLFRPLEGKSIESRLPSNGAMPKERGEEGAPCEIPLALG